MFMGEFEHSLDAKGRMIVPSKFRDGLGESFVIAKGLDKCLYGYPLDEWKQIEEQIKPSPFSKSAKRSIQRYFFSSAAIVDFDKQGRVNIPGNLQTHAELEKDCVVIGVSNRIEIWDKANWNDYISESSDSFEDFVESLEDF